MCGFPQRCRSRCFFDFPALGKFQNRLRLLKKQDNIQIVTVTFFNIKLKNITEFLKLSLFHQLCKIFGFFLDFAHAVDIFFSKYIVYILNPEPEPGGKTGSGSSQKNLPPTGSGNAGYHTGDYSRKKYSFTLEFYLLLPLNPDLHSN